MLTFSTKMNELLPERMIYIKFMKKEEEQKEDIGNLSEMTSKLDLLKKKDQDLQKHVNTLENRKTSVFKMIHE